MVEINEAKVNTPCTAYNAMASQWSLIDDLLGGTEAMTDTVKVLNYLPKFDKENDKHYNARVNNSILFSAYADTAKSICSKPFSKPVTVQGKLPEPLNEIEDDVDGQGKSLMQLAKEIFFEFINRGIGHILVDYPTTVNENGEKPNLKQERSAGFRPRFIHIKPSQLISWQTQKDSSGKPVLSRIRITESQMEPDGLWGEKKVNYIRVYEPNKWQLYVENDKNEYTLLSEGINSLGKVPLITGYSNQTGYMTAKPPLRELAETNLAHFRSDSDQRNILHMARTATLFVKGFSEDETNVIALGPNQIISTSNPEADVKFVEHTGSAIDSGLKDIEKLEQRMMMLGLQPFLQNVGNQTATGQGIDESRANCDIQAWAMSLEYMLYMAYAMAAEWIKMELPEDFNIIVFKDFAIWFRAAQEIRDLITIRQARELSRETFLHEVKRRALLSETLDVNEEINRIASEGPAFGAIGLEL
jgi:hypothetical protein